MTKSLKFKYVKLGRDPYGVQLQANRDKRSTKRAEFERVRNAEPPVAVFKSQALEKLDEIAGRDWINAQYYGGEITLDGATTAIDAEPSERGGVVTIPDLMPLLMALAGDRIRELVLARIDADHRGDTTLRLPAEEKKTRLAKLRGELLDLAHEEAALIVAIAGPDALELPFPVGMDPRAVLGLVEGPTPHRGY